MLLLLYETDMAIGGFSVLISTQAAEAAAAATTFSVHLFKFFSFL